MTTLGAPELTSTNNPYLMFYREFVREHPGELIEVFNPKLSDEARSKMYAALDVSVAMKYSWAIPDERALQIIKHYGPIVEMGAGSGYWARLLQLRGVDIIAYDLHVAAEEKESKKDDDKGVDLASDEEDNEDDEVGAAFDGENHEDEEEIIVEQVYWTDVLKGTPKDLHKHTDRALFLCYPDDFEDSHESMAMASLCNYAGDTVIHVGEMFGQTICLPGVWGRTSSKGFQIHLSTVYHKVLQVPLPSWHSDGLMYAYIPENERIDLAAASPSIRHLLLLGNNDEDVVTTKSMKRQRNSKARQVAYVEKNEV